MYTNSTHIFSALSPLMIKNSNICLVFIYKCLEIANFSSYN